jgi:dTDP-4-dehydrorhamnose reductase
VRRILLTGGTGQVGTGVRQANRGRFEIVAPGRGELDLGDAASIARAVAAGEWAAILNCGAYTAVDRAESEPELARAINAEAPRLLADAAAARGIPILHVSTDYVFDGTKDAPYSEEDAVAPLGVYGVTKEAGEAAVRASGARHIILRTAWVVSPWGHNFVRTMLRLGAERERLTVVADQLGCPTGAGDIGEALLTLAEWMLDDAAAGGTYHFVNGGEATWHDLACAVWEGRANAPEIAPIPTSAYPTPAKRPANSRLATAKITRDFGIVPRDWRATLADIMKELR